MGALLLSSGPQEGQSIVQRSTYGLRTEGITKAPPHSDLRDMLALILHNGDGGLVAVTVNRALEDSGCLNTDQA